MLLAGARLSAAAGFDRHTWQLTLALESFLHRRGRWQEQAGICELAVAATRRLDDRAGLAAALRMASRIQARRPGPGTASGSPSTISAGTTRRAKATCSGSPWPDARGTSSWKRRSSPTLPIRSRSPADRTPHESPGSKR